MNATLVRRIVTIHDVPPHILVLTAFASYTGQILASLQRWPLWAVVLATLAPWIPVFAREIVWTYRHYHWLALFYVLVVTQTGHFLEHVAQVVQIHGLGLTGAQARGVFGALDIEVVHFVWNTWVVIAVLILLVPFRRNPWMWPTLAITAWHAVEHFYIMSVYLSTGVSGTPGLLARGGLIGGGLPLLRPDLHFFYNLVETLPLIAAFVYQCAACYRAECGWQRTQTAPASRRVPDGTATPAMQPIQAEYLR